MINYSHLQAEYLKINWFILAVDMLCILVSMPLKFWPDCPYDSRTVIWHCIAQVYFDVLLFIFYWFVFQQVSVTLQHDSVEILSLCEKIWLFDYREHKIMNPNRWLLGKKHSAQSSVVSNVMVLRRLIRQFLNWRWQLLIVIVWLLLVMAALCNRPGHYVFALWFLLSIFFFFLSSPNLSSRWLDVYHTSIHGVVWI